MNEGIKVLYDEEWIVLPLLYGSTKDEVNLMSILFWFRRPAN